jgi:uncharacterized protein YcfL
LEEGASNLSSKVKEVLQRINEVGASNLSSKVKEVLQRINEVTYVYLFYWYDK